MAYWDKDLVRETNQEIWKQIWQTTAHCPVNAILIEFNYNLLMQWCMVLQNLSKFRPTSSNKCSRGCQSPGTHLYIWQEYHNINRSWTSMCKWVYSILGKGILYKNTHRRHCCTSFFWLCIFIGAKVLANVWWSSTPIITHVKHKITLSSN